MKRDEGVSLSIFSTLATVLVENGLKHEQVMKITGHKKLLTLQRYVKSGTDIDQMLEIGKKIRNG